MRDRQMSLAGELRIPRLGCASACFARLHCQYYGGAADSPQWLWRPSGGSVPSGDVVSSSAIPKTLATLPDIISLRARNNVVAHQKSQDTANSQHFRQNSVCPSVVNEPASTVTTASSPFITANSPVFVGQQMLKQCTVTAVLLTAAGHGQGLMAWMRLSALPSITLQEA